jgi:hypothetical protein
MTDIIAGMTKEELRAFIRRTVTEMLWEADQAHDPDEGLEFTSDVSNRLQSYLESKPRGKPIDDVAGELGLDA